MDKKGPDSEESDYNKSGALSMAGMGRERSEDAVARVFGPGDSVQI